jgi:hypothetical protein
VPSFRVCCSGEPVMPYVPLSLLCTRIVLGGTSELGLIGSVRESREDESEPLQIGSCWCKCGSRGTVDDAVEEMLARDAKNPPSFLVGGGAIVVLTAAGAEADDNAGETMGVGVVVVPLFQSLKPHREETEPVRATPAAVCTRLVGTGAGAGAD